MTVPGEKMQGIENLDTLSELFDRRRRVARACDECRKRKIKCNGTLPCINCPANGSNCTYNESGRKKTRQVEDLEAKLRYAQKVIEIFRPGLDIFDPGFRIDKLQEEVSQIPPNEVASPVPAKRRDTEIRVPLPPKEVAMSLVDVVWNDACILFLCCHRPAFKKILDLMYDTPMDQYSSLHFDMLPLLYSVLAVGVLFASRSQCEELGFSDASEGYRYFEEAQRRTPLAEVHNMYAVMTLVMMTLFLQCSARLTTCYTYIGIAMRSALRLGLHRKAVHQKFNPVELEIRKRLFFAIRKLDTYINAMLGLPRTIEDADFDQELPNELLDESITEEGYLQLTSDPSITSPAAISNHHTKLIAILSEVMSTIYTVRPTHLNPDPSSRVNDIYSKVERIELKLAQWRSSLPKSLELDAQTVDSRYLKANRYLGLCLCYVQTLLYRPFIHYSSPTYGSVTPNTIKAKLFALKCITVARQAVFMANDLVQHSALNGSYFFATYAIFFAVSCLMYYVSENEMDANAYEIFLDAQNGRYALKTIRESSVSASGVYRLLEAMFRQMDQKTSGWKKVISESASSPMTDTSDSADGRTADRYLPPTNGFSVMSFDQLGVGSQFMKAEDSAPTPAAPLAGLSPSGSVKLPTARVLDASPSTSISDHRSSTPVTPLSNPAPYPGDGNDDANSTKHDQNPSPRNLPDSDVDASITQPAAPGLMDQLDHQLFGRFVPPHMMPLSYFANEGNDGLIQPLEAAGLGGGDGSDLEVNEALTGTDIFNDKAWEAFLSQHQELSGINF